MRADSPSKQTRRSFGNEEKQMRWRRFGGFAAFLLGLEICSHCIAAPRIQEGLWEETRVAGNAKPTRLTRCITDKDVEAIYGFMTGKSRSSDGSCEAFDYAEKGTTVEYKIRCNVDGKQN